MDTPSSVFMQLTKLSLILSYLICYRNFHGFQQGLLLLSHKFIFVKALQKCPRPKALKHSRLQSILRSIIHYA
jgi:hypothetical protein